MFHTLEMVGGGSRCIETRNEDHDSREHNNKRKNHRLQNRGHHFGMDWNRIALIVIDIGRQ